MAKASQAVTRSWLHSLKIAALVGTLLTSIHQAQAIQHLSFGGGDMFRISLNFLVPFLVASYARASRAAGRTAFGMGRARADAAEYGNDLGAEFTVEHVRNAYLGETRARAGK